MKFSRRRYAEKAYAHKFSGTEGFIRDNAAKYTLTISPKNGTGNIPAYAFYNATQELSGIKTIIEEGITSIGESAFHKNPNNNAEFTSITIPASVTTISKNAFYSCSSLASVTIAGNSQLTSIGDNAFDSCGFSSIVLPCPGLASIGEYAFSTTQNNRLTEIICLTETALTVNNDMFYGNSANKVTVYMPGSPKSAGTWLHQSRVSSAPSFRAKAFPP